VWVWVRSDTFFSVREGSDCDASPAILLLWLFGNVMRRFLVGSLHLTAS